MNKRLHLLSILLIAAAIATGCIMPRLGKKTVRYDSIARPPTPSSAPIPIFSSRDDIKFKFVIIAEVFASPPAAERDFGHEPVELLKQQARQIGGVGLLELKREEGYLWSAKVVAKE